MERSTLRSSAYLICATTTTLLGLAISTAKADAIPAYTVTDLGIGIAQVSTNENGNGIVASLDGQRTYAFSSTDNRLTDSSVLSSLPPLTNAPVGAPMTYGNPANAYSYIISSGAFLNQNGMFVGTDLIGVAGHAQASGSLVLASQRQADGSFGPFTTVWDSPNNLYSGGQIAQAIALNNQNQILGMGSSIYSSPWERYFYLADLNSHSVINLSDVVPNWNLQGEIGLDDQGRILLSAINLFNGPGDYPTHTLLLTPAGLSSDPLTVPEPTTFATLVLGLGSLVLGGRRYSRGS